MYCVLFYINNTNSLCQLPLLSLAVCVQEAVYRHVTVELLASFQYMKKLHGMISNHDTNFVIVTFF